MLAWTTTPDNPGGLALREVPRPVASPDELLVRVEAFAPNPGDIAALSDAPDGSIPGWDGSGVVISPAADGNGPQAGERVLFLGLSAQGWAQHRAVPRAMTAVAPPVVPFEQLATLPVPATTALRALRKLGSILGRRILIVGATGAVGRIAVQLAVRSGARVVAIARDQRRHHELKMLGAEEVYATVGEVSERVHGALDMIGGQELVGAYSLLKPKGTVIALGHAAGAAEHFPYGSFVADSTTADRSISSFFLGSEPDLVEEMTYLAADPNLNFGDIDVRPWATLPQWIEAGTHRDEGRVVFRVDHSDS